MARTFHPSSTTTTAVLSDADSSRGRALLAKRTARNPLRRVRLECETTSTRDPIAVVGDHVWCETHGDFARVVSVVE